MFYNFDQSIVRSEQGGSRNLFSDYEHANKPFNVTLAFDDNQFSAHKGRTYHNYNFYLYLWNITHSSRVCNMPGAIFSSSNDFERQKLGLSEKLSRVKESLVKEMS